MEEIIQYFKKYGDITDVSLPASKENLNKGYAFVSFSNSEAVNQIIENVSKISLRAKHLDIRIVTPEEEKIHNNVIKSKYDNFQKNGTGDAYSGFNPVHGSLPNMNKNVSGFKDQFSNFQRNPMHGNFGYY